MSETIRAAYLATIGESFAAWLASNDIGDVVSRAVEDSVAFWLTQHSAITMHDIFEDAIHRAVIDWLDEHPDALRGSLGRAA